LPSSTTSSRPARSDALNAGYSTSAGTSAQNLTDHGPGHSSVVSGHAARGAALRLPTHCNSVSTSPAGAWHEKCCTATQFRATLKVQENTEIGTGQLDNLTWTRARRGNSYPAEVTNPICAIPDPMSPIPTTIGWHSMCLSVRNSNPFSRQVTYISQTSIWRTLMTSPRCLGSGTDCE
jgi:hypothetical protein